MEKSTQSLVEQTIAGDQRAFAQLVDRYRDAASAVAYSYFGCFDDVQDAVQEAFVHAYCHLRQLREPAKFGPWLRKITANVCTQVLRKRERANVSLSEIAEQPMPSDEARRIAARTVVQDALGKLSEATRLTVTLSCINGYSHAEIADFLEIPVTAVRSRLRHAKRKLREEMIEMVEEVLHEDKPGEELVRKLLECANRIGEAMRVHANEDALRRCDDALAAIRELGNSAAPEQLRERLLSAIASEGSFDGEYDKARVLHSLNAMTLHDFQIQAEAEVLVAKGQAMLQSENLDGARALFGQALQLASSIDNKEAYTLVIEKVAHNYHNFSHIELALEYLPQVVEAAREAGNALKEATNLWGLANMHLDDSRPAVARPMYERARALFHEIDRPARAVMAQAAIDLIETIGERNWASVVQCMASCIVLAKSGSAIEVTGEGGGWTSRPSGYPWQPMALCGLGTILDAASPAGTSWQEEDPWLTNGPLEATDTVLSYDEIVTVAGRDYSGCALIERATVEDKLPDGMSEKMRELLRFNIGSIRQWFAPGVGLVRLVAGNDSGYQAVIELQECSIIEPSTDYLPLAIGNSWTYGWVDAPEGYTAKEYYRVRENEGEHWYLENYRYVLNNG